MQICSCLNVRFYVLLCASLLAGTVSRAAVALTLTPSTISNTYPGSVSLQITGLVNGETVLLERFIDANANATVDSGELLVQSFQVTDGRVTTFGGVRDPHIAGDEDGLANGQIGALYYFLDSPEFSSGLGSYVFRVLCVATRVYAATHTFNGTHTDL